MCKFYQGSEDKALELRLKSLFARVHREKPESSRSVSNRADLDNDKTNLLLQESKEGYFVALRRKANTSKEYFFQDDL